MSILCWNCRGLGNPRTVRDLCRLVKEKKPKLVFLIETKLRTDKLERIRIRIGFNSVFGVDSVGRSGGLALLWSDEISVEVQNYSRRHVNALVCLSSSGPKWVFTGFYGNPEPWKRHESWSLLKFLSASISLPWLCMGDFNEIMDESERSGELRSSRGHMMNFRETMDFCRLQDLGFSGPKYTWCNRREGLDFLEERLDRSFANQEWFNIFPDVQMQVTPACSSDHYPLFLPLLHAGRNRQKKPRRFLYESCWGKHLQPRELVRQVWRVKKQGVNVWEDLHSKMGNSKRVLLCWKKKNASPTEEIVKKKIGEIQLLQEIGGSENLTTIRSLQNEVDVALADEESKWRQRAKEQWLKLGDKNSKYFHACASQKNRRNKIHRVEDEEGQVCDSQEDIEAAFLHYYQNLFSTSVPGGVEEAIQGLERRVQPDMNAHLISDITDGEIEEAIFQMAPQKSPGPDGFPVEFYQDNWGELKEEVCAAIHHFFVTGCFDFSVNRTCIALIPKVKEPVKVSDFRPISLCNVVYKILSKVLANRLKWVLPSIISKTQSAFIPGRLISDNILVAYETMHSMHSRMWGKVGYMAVKLDMSKAYDRVEWVFLEEVMKKMGFEVKWINWVMKCITTVQYDLLINGNQVGPIIPSRGIRQGDPLSPYLFLLCAEVLSLKLQMAQVGGLLMGVPTSPRGPRINHLFFADDSLIFCRAQQDDWENLSWLLENYEKASGQRLNRSKTSIFFSRNTSPEMREKILQLSNIPASQRYDKYLGLPALVGKSRIREFKSITDRARRRMCDWKTKFLSQAGKEILIKAVVQAIPTYSMSLFLLPKELSRELNSMMQRFWWGHKDNERKIHWMSWSKMGLSKTQGGMGFRDLVAFNKALLAKQCWRLIQFPDSLAGSVLKAKYYRKGNLLEANMGSRPSLVWRSLMASRDLLREGLFWRIGDGESTRIWGDKWIPKPSSFLVQSPCVILNPEAKVKELMDQNMGGWNVELIRSIFHKDEAELICNLPCSRYRAPDKLIWRCTKSGDFSVRSAYHLEMERTSRMRGESSRGKDYSNFWKTLWSLQVPNSTKVFLWRACNNILPTKEIC
jgi:hypothetical protein